MQREVLNTKSLGVSFIALFFVGYLLVIGRNILIPFVVALFLWFLINALSRFYARFVKLPQWGLVSVSLLSFVGLVLLPVELVSRSVPQVLELAPKYQDNFQNLVSGILQKFNVSQDTVLKSIMAQLDISKITQTVATAFTQLAGNTILISIYLLFLLLEQGRFEAKVKAITKQRARYLKVQRILTNLSTKIQDYLWVKTIVSAITALASYGIMLLVGLDFAAFWAMLLFMLNFIPNVGAIIATVFPSLIALVQFDALTPFFIVTGGICMVHFMTGSLLEPKLLSRSLDLSGLVIILALVIWGSLWGIAGMFLCVPITVMLKIILAEFDSTKPWAIALSHSGKV